MPSFSWGQIFRCQTYFYVFVRNILPIFKISSFFKICSERMFMLSRLYGCGPEEKPQKSPGDTTENLWRKPPLTVGFSVHRDIPRKNHPWQGESPARFFLQVNGENPWTPYQASIVMSRICVLCFLSNWGCICALCFYKQLMLIRESGNFFYYFSFALEFYVLNASV